MHYIIIILSLILSSCNGAADKKKYRDGLAPEKEITKENIRVIPKSPQEDALRIEQRMHEKREQRIDDKMQEDRMVIPKSCKNQSIANQTIIQRENFNNIPSQALRTENRIYEQVRQNKFGR